MNLEVQIELPDLIYELVNNLQEEKLFWFITELEKQWCDKDFLIKIKDHFDNEYKKMIAGNQ